MNSKKIAREIISISSKIKDESLLIDSIASKIDAFVLKEAKKLNNKSDFISQVRTAFADYVKTEGCGCCEDGEGHNAAMEKIAPLLEIEKYEDGSGYDTYKYGSK